MTELVNAVITAESLEELITGIRAALAAPGLDAVPDAVAELSHDLYLIEQMVERAKSAKRHAKPDEIARDAIGLGFWLSRIAARDPRIDEYLESKRKARERGRKGGSAPRGEIDQRRDQIKNFAKTIFAQEAAAGEKIESHIILDRIEGNFKHLGLTRDWLRKLMDKARHEYQEAEAARRPGPASEPGPDF
jgi:hypothetical protein